MLLLRMYDSVYMKVTIDMLCDELLSLEQQCVCELQCDLKRNESCTSATVVDSLKRP